MVPSCGDDDDSSGATAALCERAAADAILACFEEVSSAHGACIESDGAICPEDDPALDAASTTLDEAVHPSCSDPTVREAGFGPSMTTTALVRRLDSSCRAEARSVAVRTYGGPHGAAWADADESARDCLTDAHDAAVALVTDVLAAHTECIEADSDCDRTAVANDIAGLRNAAAAQVANECEDLSDLVAVDPPTYADRAIDNAECATAMSHPASASFLDLACGPRDSTDSAPRGEYTQVVLDSDEWGTRCGDGSPFAFQLRLAPEGAPLENIIIAMQGGGVCIFGDDCASASPGLFEALSDRPLTTGFMSDDPEENPFADWTKVYLPYCNQDVFIGGGATNVFPEVTVHRFGAINVRAAVSYVRNLVWRELDATTEEGYRQDRMRAFFGGFSAGAFGTLYNYHWMLDDLQWEHTTGFPDAAVALDSGGALSVAALGAILIPESDIGWSSLPYLPSYCFDFDCGVGPIGLARTSPRLKAVPEQQILVLTNQVDEVQVFTTFFPDTVSWVNELREQFCLVGDLPGAHFYLPAFAESIHVISPRPELYLDNTVDGETMVDWMWGAVTNPDDVVDRVEEGNLVEERPGVVPFPCEVAP